MVKDQEIFDLIEREHQRQLKGMELIASENFVSDEVMNAMGSYLTNKYAEGLPGKRYYGGCQVVDIVENLAIERVKKVFGAEYANVQPHSGAQANAAVLLAVLKPGDTFMGLNLDHGGHLSHGSHVNTSGILYNPIGYNLNKETGRVDYDEMEKLALEYKPKLIIGGGSAYSREWDYARMRKIADEVGALLMIDMAHPAGLIAAGLLDNPLKYAHIVTSTTHKTLRGPRGGIILMGKDFDNPWGLTTKKGEVKKMSMLLNSAVFPGQQGGPLEHVIAAKAVAFNENLQPSWKEYSIWGNLTQWREHQDWEEADLKYRALKMVLPSNDPNIRYIEKHFNVQRDEDIIDKLRTQVDVYEDSVYHYHKMVEIASYKDSIVRQLIDESNRIKMQINSKKSK